MPKKKQKVLICMSGGVDSSVAAALLVQQGYEVVGAYMKQWSDTKGLSGVCSWKDDRRDALRVAAHLGIPLLTLDFEKEYKKLVVAYMFSEYKKGRTPNPDVYCNTFVKFGFWLKYARELGFDSLATGHYAQVKKIKNRFHLLESKDTDKDQTYFLHQLGQDQLKHVLFPIGGYTKKQVRTLAKKFRLPTAERAESMGICFIGEVPMKEFLQQKIKPQPGNIVLSNGEVIGLHEGLPFYTIGQRHFGQKLKTSALQESNKPLYVLSKNKKKNELIVGFEDDPLLYTKEIDCLDLHWVNGQEPRFPLQCEVRMRHRQQLQNATLVPGKKGSVLAQFPKFQKAVTPGQFAVFYKDGECLGGGVIR